MPASRDYESANVPDAYGEQIRDHVGHCRELTFGLLVPEDVLVSEGPSGRKLAVDFFVRLTSLCGCSLHGKEVERIGLEERLKGALAIGQQVDRDQPRYW